MDEIENINLWFEAQSKEILVKNGIHTTNSAVIKTVHKISFGNENTYSSDLINSLYYSIFQQFM